MKTTKKDTKKKDGDFQDTPMTLQTTSEVACSTSKREVKKMDPMEVEQVDYEVLGGMGKLNRSRLTRSDEDSLTLRQKQAAGAEYLASLIAHPRVRKELVEAAIRDPLAILKIASSERPKEIHLEADVQHSVVVVPAQQSAEEWESAVKTIQGEVLKEQW